MTRPSSTARLGAAAGRWRDAAAAVRWRDAAARVRRIRSRADIQVLTGLGLLLSVLYWPYWPLVPAAGLDESWRYGLAHAHQLGLAWGSEIVFTYGPLYFLDFPLASSRLTVLLGAVAWVAYAMVLTYAVHAALRLGLPELSANARYLVTAAIGGIMLALPAESGLQNMHVLVVIGFVLATAAVIYPIRWLPTAVGVVLGLLLVHKLSDAAVMGAFAVICVSASAGLAGALRLAAGTAIAFLVGWVVAGQSMADILPYVAAEFEIVRGYARAMSTFTSGLQWHYPVALVLAVSVVWAMSRATVSLLRWRRRAVAAGTGVALWVAAHEAFTRHDGHFWYFFGIVLVLCLCLAALTRSDGTRRLALVTGAVAYVMVATVYMPLNAPVERQASLNAATRVLGVLSSQGRAAQLFDGANRENAESYRITAELGAALRALPTTVDPWDINALAAAGGTWDPLPVIQNYSAYTPALDQINAASLAARPRQILRNDPYPSIDGRNPFWETPRVQRIIYCTYDVALTTPGWQLLRPAASSRCSDPPEPGDGPIDAAANEAVTVPRREGAITLATITPQRSILESAFDFVAKPPMVYVGYGGQWRLAQNPSAVELMLNTPLPHASFPGLPPAPHDTISVSLPARIEFQFLPVDGATIADTRP